RQPHVLHRPQKLAIHHKDHLLRRLLALCRAAVDPFPAVTALLRLVRHLRTAERARPRRPDLALRRRAAIPALLPAGLQLAPAVITVMNRARQDRFGHVAISPFTRTDRISARTRADRSRPQAPLHIQSGRLSEAVRAN